MVYDHHNGELTEKQAIKADTVGARGSADIHVSPDGRFLYASNRLEADGIAIFAIDPDEVRSPGGISPLEVIPISQSPNGKYLLVASRDENRIQVFSVDEVSGLLNDTKQDILLSKPVCLKFAQSN